MKSLGNLIQDSLDSVLGQSSIIRPLFDAQQLLKCLHPLQFCKNKVFLRRSLDKKCHDEYIAFRNTFSNGATL